MPIATARLKAQRFASASLISTLTGVLLVFGTLGLTFTSEHNRTQDIVGRITVLLFVGSMGLAIIGLFKDPEKVLALCALMLAFVALAVFGLFNAV